MLMKLDFKIDRNAGTAAYRQIMSGITTMVRDGKLVPGDKLPSEREMAGFFGISRGTVKKAYDKLCTNGVTQSVVGSGTFISIGQDVIRAGRKQQALEHIEKLVGRLSSDGFSYREIETHFNLVINKYRTQSKLAKIAAIDCSPEALYTFEEQLGYIKQVEIDRILLTDLEDNKYPRGYFMQYDLILTTSTHHEEIMDLLPEVENKIMQAIVSPDTETVIELAGIPKDKTVAVVCLSERYLRVILKFMTRDVAEKNTLVFSESKAEIDDFLKGKDYLILPPEHILDSTELEDLSGFTANKGKVIYFNYQIERGSLIHIEEKISEILHRKIGGAV
jgi:DNA-binding transcriptional regulator YhcF (GntR family)